MTTCSVCSKEISGADVMYTADARVVCPACFETSQDAGAARARPKWLALATIGGVVGAIPFAVHFSSSNVESVNGVVTKLVYRDWIAVACGATAAVIGIAVLAVGRHGLMRKQAVLAALALVGLGGFQIAKGLGVFATASAGSSGELWTGPSITPSVVPAETPPVAPPVAVVDPTKPETCPDQHQCFALGRKLEGDKDPTAATVAYERSCELGAAGGCFNAGVMLRVRKEPDLEKADRMVKRGCDLGDLDSCNEVGIDLRRGRGVGKDLARAKTVFTEGCDHASAIACANLGSLYEDGEGVPVDLEKALALYVKACDPDASEDLAGTCASVGVLLVEGKGIKHDLKRAATYFTKACNQAAKACHGLAVMTAQGNGVAKDPPKARELYRKACDAGAFASCNNLGDMENRGLGGPKDAADAKLLFKQACDGGEEIGCKNLK